MTETTPFKKGTRRPVLWAAGIVVAVLVSTILLVPLLVDAESFRPQIERALGDVTGWDAELGEIELSLLRGALGVRPARLSAPGGDTSSVEVGRIDVEVGLLALLRKELRIESIRLQQPEVVLVRPSEDAGWVSPSIGAPETEESSVQTPGRKAGSARGTGSATSESPEDTGLAIVIEEIGIRDGNVRLEDRATDLPFELELTGVSADFFPADRGISGRLKIGESDGSAQWRGTVGGVIEVTLEDIPTELLQAFVGPDLVHAGGALSGQIKIHSPLRADGRFEAEGLTLLSGERPFDDVSLEFAIAPFGLGWELQSMELRAGEALLTGSGSLAPDLALAIELPETPLEAVVRAADSVLPLPLDVSPPGHLQASIRVDQPAGGELTYEASGSLAAAEVSTGELLPAAEDIQARFDLDRSGQLDVSIDKGTIAGGSASGHARLTSFDPPGRLEFSGDLRDAVFGKLLGGLVREVQPVLGPTGFDAVLGVDLSRPSIDARALSGRVEFGARQLSMPGWDLDTALRTELQQKLASGTSGLLQSYLDRKSGKGEAPVEDVASAVEQLIDDLQGTVVFDRWPWGLENVQLVVGDVTSTGNGTFDPERGEVEFTLSSSLSVEESRKLMAKHSALKLLADPSGRLTLPVTVRGSLVAPKLGVELGDALERNLLGDDAEKEVKSLLKGLLDRD